MYVILQFVWLNRHDSFHAYSSALVPCWKVSNRNGLSPNPPPPALLSKTLHLFVRSGKSTHLQDVFHDGKQTSRLFWMSPEKCNLQAGKMLLIVSVQEAARLLSGRRNWTGAKPSAQGCPLGRKALCFKSRLFLSKLSFLSRYFLFILSRLFIVLLLYLVFLAEKSGHSRWGSGIFRKMWIMSGSRDSFGCPPKVNSTHRHRAWCNQIRCLPRDACK